MKQPAIAISVTTSAILVIPRTRIIAGEKVSGFIGKIVYTTKHCGFNSNQSIHFRFRIQNFGDETKPGRFFFRIHPSGCKRQNESGNKKF